MWEFTVWRRFSSSDRKFCHECRRYPYNSAILSKLKLKYEAEGHQKALARLKKISPVAWQHIHFQGHFIFSGDNIIDIDAMINNVFLGDLDKPIVIKNRPKISTVPG